MNDITMQELEVWKLYAEPEYVPPPMPVYEVLFTEASLQPYEENLMEECSLGTRAPTRSYLMPVSMDVHMSTLWKNPRYGVPQGVNAFSLENRRRALAILLDIPEDKLDARDSNMIWR